jgi:hypothetical protein
MPIAGNEAARRLVKPHCISLVQKAQSHYEIEDPLSDVKRHLKPVEITNNGAVYARMEKHPDRHPDRHSDRTKMSKIDCSSHFRDRIDLDIEENKKKNIILTDDNYIRILDLENVCEEFNEEMELGYKQVMEKMMGDKSLSPLHRRFFEALHLEGGEELGAKKNIMLQMLEYGCQIESGTSAPAEFLMYADNVVER